MYPAPLLPASSAASAGTEFVRWVQHSLNSVLGSRLPVNGVMSPGTRQAVRDFQARMNLPVDGIVGPATQRVLEQQQQAPSGGESPTVTDEPATTADEPDGNAAEPQPAPPPEGEYEEEFETEFDSEFETEFEDEAEEDEEEEFNLNSFPVPVRQALASHREDFAVKLAIVYGFRNENELSDLVFFGRHPERSGRSLVKGEPGFQSLSQEWIRIRDQLVRPAIRSPILSTPLPALSTSEQAEYDRLSASARSAFDQLRTTIQTFSGIARNEADRGGRVLLSRGLFTATPTLLPQLIRLVQIGTLPAGWSLSAAHPLLVGNVLYNLAFPETINQGGFDRLGGTPDPTCFSASTQILLARRFPATYVRYVVELASTSKCTFAGGDKIGPLTLTSTSLYKSLDSVLLQTAFDRYFDTTARSGSYKPGDELKVHRQVFGANRPPRHSTSGAAFSKMMAFFKAFLVKSGTTRLPEILNLCTGDPSSNCGNHTVVLTRITGGRVYFYNPWANEEERNTMFGSAKVSTSGNGERPAESSMTLSDLIPQITTVFHN